MTKINNTWSTEEMCSEEKIFTRFEVQYHGTFFPISLNKITRSIVVSRLKISKPKLRESTVIDIKFHIVEQ